MKPPFTVMKIEAKHSFGTWWFYVVDGDDARVSGPWSTREHAQMRADRLTTEHAILAEAER